MLAANISRGWKSKCGKRLETKAAGLRFPPCAMLRLVSKHCLTTIKFKVKSAKPVHADTLTLITIINQCLVELRTKWTNEKKFIPRRMRILLYLMTKELEIPRGRATEAFFFSTEVQRMMAFSPDHVWHIQSSLNSFAYMSVANAGLPSTLKWWLIQLHPFNSTVTPFLWVAFFFSCWHLQLCIIP